MIDIRKPDVWAFGADEVPRSMWTDPRLNGNAVRLIGHLLTRRPGRPATRRALMSEMNLGGTAYEAAIAKAEGAGWLRRYTARTPEGDHVYVYEVRDRDGDEGGRLFGEH